MRKRTYFIALLYDFYPKCKLNANIYAYRQVNLDKIAYLSYNKLLKYIYHIAKGFFMNDNFIGLRRRILIATVIKAVLFGLSVGLIVSSAIALSQRLIIESVNWLLCSLILVGLLLLVGGIYFLLSYPTEKRVAKRLDSGLALKEKVQTMLAYKKSEGSIYDLQRDDTNKALDGAKIVTIGVKSIIAFTHCILLGAGMVVATALIPDKPEPPTVTPFELTEIQIDAIEEIILYVSNSEMDEPYKTNVAASLTSMLDDLKLVTTVEDRDVILDATISAILLEGDNSSSALEIITELWRTDFVTAKLLAKAVNYYDLPKLDDWEKYLVKANDLKSAFTYKANDENEPTEEEILEITKILFATSGEKIITALAASKINEDDALYKVLLRLASANEVDEKFGTRLYGYQTLSEIINIIGYKDAQRELDSTFTILNNEIFSVISQHRTNTETAEYAVTKICALFSYPIPKFERPQLIESSTDDSSDENDPGGVSGGIGEGTKYGSDDLVYDPLSNTYVEYGVIIEKYHALMNGKAESGEYTEEERLALIKYFDILYNGFDEENENTENENTENGEN